MGINIPFCQFFIYCILIFISSCKETAEINLVAPSPSAITLPPHIKTLVFSDRSGENKNAFIGFRKEIATISNYKTLFVNLDPDFRQTPAPPLVWATVADLVNKDSTKISVVLEEYVKPYSNNNHSSFPIFYWRVYDWKNKTILDECKYVGNSYFTIDSLAGRDYADRLVPQFFNETRDYYRLGNSQMKKADKMVRYIHWDQAVKIWEKLSVDSTAKIVPKVFFNLAVAEELKGNFDQAIQYAERSKRLGNVKADNYILLIKRHKRAMEQFQNEPEKAEK